MITATLLIGTLVAGSIASLTQSVSAKSNYSYYLNSQNRNTSGDAATSNTSKSGTGKVTTTKTTTPATTTTTPPAATNTSTTTPAQTTTPATSTPAAATTAATSTPVATKTTPVATQSAVASTVTPAAPATIVDTAAESATLTAAQAIDTNKSTAAPVSYTSGLLPNQTRTNILMFAGVMALTGVLLYIISFIGTRIAPMTRRAIPVRYIVPVQEGFSR